MRLHLPGCALFVLLSVPSLALAQDAAPRAASAEAIRALPSRLGLAVPACDAPPIPWRALVAQLEVELRGLDVELDRGASEASIGARIVLRVPGCSSAATELRVSLVNLESGRASERAITIPGPENQERVRVVALAIVELLRERWPALSEDPFVRLAAMEQWRVEHDASTARRIADADARLEASDVALEAARAELSATDARLATLREQVAELERTREPTPAAPGALVTARFLVRAFLSGGAALLGPAFGVELPVGPLRLSFDAALDAGERAHELGDVALLGVRGGIALLGAYRAGSVSFSAGPLLALGWARAKGQPLDPLRVSGREVTGTMVELGARAMLHAPLFGRLRVSLNVDLGYALGGVDARALSERVTNLGGPVLAAGIGISYAL